MDQQTSLFDTPAAAPAPSVNDPDSFGCCSRYRECSDARKCLIADVDYSTHCSYRKHLEGGRIFYGKNAPGFDPAQYAEILRRADSLPPSVRSAFDAIVIDLCEYHRGARRCMVRNEHIPELSAVGLFDFHPLGSEFLPARTELWDYKNALSLVMDHPHYGPLFRQAQADRSEEKPKEFLRRWLNRDAVPLRDLLSDPYRFAALRPEHALCMEEFYRDTLLSGYDGRIYLRSPFAEDGFFTRFTYEEEELRRVKLSRGYSNEEKARRLDEIQQARAARIAERRKNGG